MVDKELIIKNLLEAGINPVGSYKSLPDVIGDAVETIDTFGYDYWLTTTSTGPKIKTIVKKLTMNARGGENERT